MRKLRIIGDSHVLVLYVGWERVAEKFGALPFQVEFLSLHGANWFEFKTTETDRGLRFYSNRVAEAHPDHELYTNSALDYVIDSLDDLYVFVSPLHSASIYREPSWQTFCPWECAEANPDLQAVSTSVMEAWFEAHIKCRLSMMKMMKERGYNLAVAEAPKPLVRTAAQFALRQDGLLASDRLYREFVCRRLRENEIPVISVPEHTHSEGFTTDEYSASDPTDPHHGNDLWGAETMTKLLQFADEMHSASQVKDERKN